MRILLAGHVHVPEAMEMEVEGYLKAGHQVTVNTIGLSPDIIAALKQKDGVQLEHFDPSRAEQLQSVIEKDKLGYDAIIYPPNIAGFTKDVCKAATSDDLQHKLTVIGCPNAAVDRTLTAAADEHHIPIVHTPDVHAHAVAEYTLHQIAAHARDFNRFYDATGKNGEFPHDSAVTSTNMIRGKTLGVLGGSGKDGGAVMAKALELGMKVVTLKSSSDVSNAAMRMMGVEIVSDPMELFKKADFISVNCRSGPKTAGLINKDAIAVMKPGMIIVNPAGAEIIDKAALIEEFSKLPVARKLSKIILDMPYGGRRDHDAFRADPDNSRLKDLGVLFTPRMAGYTKDTRIQAVAELTGYMNSALAGNFTVPIANPSPNFPTTTAGEYVPIITLDEAGKEKLAQDIIELTKMAGLEAMRLRNAGLQVVFKADSSPTTNADREATRIIHDGLRKKGYRFNFSGEDQGTESTLGSNIEVIIDGIDGTNNFKNNEFGWCSSVAIKQGGKNIIGVVHDAESNKTFSAVAGKGAYLEDRFGKKKLGLPVEYDDKFQYSVGSFQAPGMTGIKNKITEGIKKLGGRERQWGSIALSICAVAQGAWGAFVQGNSKEYDHAAARIIAEEAGAAVSCEPAKKTGREKSGDDVLSDVIVTHPKLMEPIQTIFRTCRTSRPSSPGEGGFTFPA